MGGFSFVMVGFACALRCFGGFGLRFDSVLFGGLVGVVGLVALFACGFTFIDLPVGLLWWCFRVF